ncbi:hypothetical protein HB943_12220 [Listeria weihenstephanensis]|uniref:LXG domain-containing protein n=1 Tax=Listeria weihenstephanensis TaxID=1006155 RepID=A0A841Z928_9LIST|nr:deaminase domain-containing protein [Listeria weihenstephanensis]MBC1501369.1 hypothetical protein [Listeria weihenstephanensis]
MSYLIKYDDITSFSSYAGQKLNGYQEQLDAIQGSLDGIAGLEQLKGSAADSIKNYLNEVHTSLIASIQQLIMEYQSRLLLYKDGYYEGIDSDLHAQIDEDLLGDKKTFFNTSSTDFENTYSDFTTAISNIQDMLPSNGVKPDWLRTNYTDVGTHINTHKENTGTYEATHQKDDLTIFKSMLLSIQQLIKENQANPQGVTTYQAGDIANFPSAAGLNEALQSSSDFLQGNSAAIEAASGRESARWDALQAEYEEELAKEREKNGWLQIVGGAAAVLIGGAAIVLTAGAATPLVVAAYAFGGGAMLYGAAEMSEGSENVAYGRAGDAYSLASNPLRDTIFMGNQEAYDIFGMIAVTGSSIIIPGALAYRSAATAGQIVGVGEIAGTAMTRAAVGELGGYLLTRTVPPLLEPYVGSDWAAGIGFTAGMVASAGGGAWAARGINSALDIPTTGVFKPRVVAETNGLKSPSQLGVTEKVSEATKVQKIENFQSRIDDIRGQMPNSKLKNQGNMAVADVNIKDLPDEFMAHSKIHGADSKGADLGEFSHASENRIFESYTVDKFPRYNDTEVKILEDIASKITDPNVSGKIDLYTELPTCQSCTNVIFEFRKKFPNIELNIFTK